MTSPALRNRLFLLPLIVLICGSCVTDPGTNEEYVTAGFTVGCHRVANFTTEFSNLSFGADRYQWDFGNGGTSTKRDPILQYDQAGTYQVQLIAESNSGSSDTARMELTIYPFETTSGIVSLPAVDPGIDDSCWTASVDAVLQHFGDTVERCEISSTAFLANCCPRPELCSNAVPLVEDINRTLRTLGNLKTAIAYGPLDFEDIQLEVMQNRPVIAIYESAQYRTVRVISGFEDRYSEIIVGRACAPPDTVFYWNALQIDEPSGPLYWTYSIYCINPR
jgi:hypothetical protein